MLNTMLQNYVDWNVKPVMRIKQGYGYRVILKYMDGSEKVQQKSGFSSEREASIAREKTIAELKLSCVKERNTSRINCEEEKIFKMQDIFAVLLRENQGVKVFISITIRSFWQIMDYRIFVGMT